MFPFFHVAIPLLYIEVLNQKRNWHFSRFFIIIGSMLPDIIEKPLAFMEISSGRALFHTPLLWVGIGFILFSLIPKMRPEINSLLIGVFFHLILDLPYIPILWPFVEYDWDFLHNPWDDWIWALTHNPLIISTEIIGFIILLFLVLKYKLIFNWNRIRDFLFLKTRLSPQI